MTSASGKSLPRAVGTADRMKLPWSSHAVVAGVMILLVLLLVGVNRSSTGAAVWNGWAEAVELRKPIYAERVRPDEIFRTCANTWSNLAYVLVGLYAFAYGWHDLRRTRSADDNYLVRTPVLSFLFAAACCYLGVGSGFFHASMTRFGQQLDVAAMYAPLVVWIAIGVGRRRPLLRWPGQAGAFPTWPVLSGVVVLACFLLYQFKWSMRAGVVLPSLILAVLALGVSDRFQSRWRFAGGWLIAGTIALVIGVVCRQLDVAGRFSGPDTWFQGHSWWHLLTGLSLACIYLHHRSEQPLPVGG